LAQRRVSVFFWPTRASSQNQTSIGLPPTACAISARRSGGLRVLGVMARTGRELAVAHRPQDPAQGLLGNRHAVILGQDLGQIAEPPAYHAVSGGNRPLFDQRLEDVPLIGVQARTGPRGLAVDQPVRAIGVEGQDPVAHRLQPDPADLGRLRARAARRDHRQRQQAAGLGRIA
jgi:hypothetical protein